MGKAEFVKAWDQWKRDGELGPAPSAPAYGILLGDCMQEIMAVEFAMREETGKSNWQYYDPKFYKPMMAARQLAALKRQAKKRPCT